jgi:hypothetical protein
MDDQKPDDKPSSEKTPPRKREHWEDVFDLVIPMPGREYKTKSPQQSS